MLDENLLKLAKENLNETKEKREESLILLNEWMDKHEILKNYKPRNEIILLAILRRTKFNLKDAFARIEQIFSLNRKFPRLFIMNAPKEIMFKKNVEMFEAGIWYRL